MAQAIFASGMLLGGAGGQALGGILGARYGWQYALFVVAVAGLVPAIAVSSLQEPPCGPSCETVPISRILRVPAFGVMLAAGACLTFPRLSVFPWRTHFSATYNDFSLRPTSIFLPPLW